MRLRTAGADRHKLFSAFLATGPVFKGGGQDPELLDNVSQSTLNRMNSGNQTFDPLNASDMLSHNRS